MTNITKATFIGVILLIFALPGISYGGHFTLAFQRQLSAWENSAGTGCIGGHVCRVWVWDEEGNPVPDIQLKTTWDVLMGATDIDGRAEIPIWTDDFDLKCVDVEGATSDYAFDDNTEAGVLGTLLFRGGLSLQNRCVESRRV